MVVIGFHSAVFAVLIQTFFVGLHFLYLGYSISSWISFRSRMNGFVDVLEWFFSHRRISIVIIVVISHKRVMVTLISLVLGVWFFLIIIIITRY